MSVGIDDKGIYQCDKDVLFCLKHCVREVSLIRTMPPKPCRIELVPKDRCVGCELETDFIDGSREERMLRRMLARVGCEKSRRLAMFLQKHLVASDLSSYNMMMRCAIMRSCPYRMEMLMERWNKEQKEKSKEEGR